MLLFLFMDKKILQKHHWKHHLGFSQHTELSFYELRVLNRIYFLSLSITKSGTTING